MKILKQIKSNKQANHVSKGLKKIIIKKGNKIEHIGITRSKKTLKGYCVILGRYKESRKSITNNTQNVIKVKAVIISTNKNIT